MKKVGLLGVMALVVGAVGFIVVMIVSSKPPRVEKGTIAKAVLTEPAPVDEAPVPEAAPAEPAPVQEVEDLGAIEERIASVVKPRPAYERLDAYLFSRSQLSEKDYEAARGLYLCFLDNFARIKTARFHVELYARLEDGREVPCQSQEVFWEYPKYRTEISFYRDGSPHLLTRVCDGTTMCWAEDGRRVDRSKWHEGRSYPGNYVYAHEMTLIQEAHPWFLNAYTNCEVNPGGTGGRLWGPEGDEARFDSVTGLLTGWNCSTGPSYRHTYQNVSGLWFPLETMEVPPPKDKPADVREYRIKFSDVVLNEPIEAGLFDVDGGARNQEKN